MRSEIMLDKQTDTHMRSMRWWFRWNRYSRT